VSPEVELLLCCARVMMDVASIARAQRLLQEDLDWRSLLQTALHHGVMPLLYRNVPTLHPVTGPHAALEPLRHAFHTHAGRALFLTGALCQILSVLEAHRIVAIPFKGPALAATVYGNPILRQFGDLDILVHKHEVLRARDLLLAQGYRPYTPMTGSQEATHLRARYHYNVLRDDGQVMVEIHWAFARRYWGIALEMAHVQERCIPVSLLGTPLRTLAPEDLLLILAIHGAKHYWPRLGWICDVAEVLRVYPGLDWDQVLAHASALGTRRILGLSLRLAQDLYSATLPDEMVQQLQTDPAVGVLAAQVRQHLFAQPGYQLSPRERQVFYFRLRERRRERIAYLCYQLRQYGRQALTPTAAERALLPLHLTCLLPLLRPLRVVWKYGWRAPHHLLQLLWQGIRSP
jgi:hypothetical protein